MKRPISFILLINLLLFCAVGTAQETADHPWLEQQDSATREMLKTYGADEAFLSAQDRMMENERLVEEARQKERRTQSLFLVLSALVALYPAGKAIAMARKGELKAYGAAGVVAFAFAILLGSAVLFAVNYGWLTLQYKMGDSLYFPISILFVLGLILSAIVLLKKK